MMIEGTGGDKAYLVLGGEVEVHRHRQRLVRVGSGEFIGEIAVLQHRPRTATVVAGERLELLHFTSLAFEGLCRDVPAFATAVEDVIGSRLAR